MDLTTNFWKELTSVNSHDYIKRKPWEKNDHCPMPLDKDVELIPVYKDRFHKRYGMGCPLRKVFCLCSLVLFLARLTTKYSCVPVNESLHGKLLFNSIPALIQKTNNELRINNIPWVLWLPSLFFFLHFYIILFIYLFCYGSSSKNAKESNKSVRGISKGQNL